MILLRLCRNILPRLLVALVIISSLAASPAYCQETEDSQVFIAGFNAYQQKDYASSIEKMNEVLQKYPDTPLRDMALFWLSRSYYKAGNQREAARYLSQFSKEYPENPLRNTAESDLLALTARYENGEELPTGQPLPKLAAVPDAKALAAAKENEAKMAAEAARTAALEQTEQKAAAERKEMERAAAIKAEQVRIAQETEAREKAEQQRIAAIKSAEERKAAEKAAAKTEQDRLTAEQAAATKIEQDRLAAAKAEETLRAEVEAETARINAQKIEAARIAQIKADENRIAIAKAAETRLTEQRHAEEKDKATKQAYREKAISQYKTIIDKFPTSKAAVTAVTKLRELGVAVALPVQAAETPAAAENAQVLRFEVAQFAGFEFNLLPRPDTSTVGEVITIPFEVINRGNGNDSFYLESAFPADFKTRFASAAAPEVAISQTPDLVPGETFKGLIELVIPPGSIDGLRITHPVKAASRLLAEASQSREVQLTASAPLLRAVLRTDKTKILPGDKPVYRIAILNVGSTAAQDVTLRLNFPPQFEPVDYAASGFRQEMKSALVLDGLQLKSGESREFSVSLQLKDDSLAGQELSTRAELINNKLKTTAAFVSNLSSVESRHGISVRSGSDNLITIPGQTVTVPVVVTNTGNIREKFKISHVVTGAQSATVFNDLNRDGIHQAGEPEISEIGPLAPREEAGILLEIKTPVTAADNSSGNVQVSFAPEGDNGNYATGSIKLAYSRPLLKMAMTGLNGRLKPGDIASFDLTITNNGSNLARIVVLQSAWPDQLELVAADPATSAVSNGAVVWRFKELGAAEKRSIKVSFRVKPGIGVGTAIQVKNILSYEDQLGNRY
ncbi:MAG: tetratricopeptide repeat protein [Desulfuromonadaceae bacterium]|nr:tetratricopeptide repeat protein [Desulfuromonadaceae bacterium]MDD2848596.1 tetratricopeptide repeat protein [Desulfuromonadaceae bacterium]